MDTLESSRVTAPDDAPTGFGTASSRHTGVRDAAVLVAVLIITGLLVWLRLDRGWIAHDEGTLGHPAERVLQGELPHADFDEVYTGGLTFVHAAVFRLFGLDLFHLRILAYGVFLLTVPATFYLSRQFFAPVAAGVATLLASTLSFPNYTAAMPSWYLLFASIFAAAALVRFADTRSLRWIFVAGVVVGVACAIKITGLYLMAAVLAQCLFLSQAEQGDPLPPRAGRAWSAFVTLCLAVLIAGVYLLIAPRLTLAELLHFLVPALAIVLLLLQRQWTYSPVRAGVSFALRSVAAVLAGWLVVSAFLLIPFVMTGTVRAFLHGVFLAPGSRLTSAAIRPPALDTLIAIIPVALALAAARLRMPRRRTAAIIIAGVFALLFLMAGNVYVYRVAWFAMRWAGPVCVLVATLMLARAPRPTSRATATLALLAALVAFTGLNQFPFSAPIYFLYVAPLVALLLGGIFERVEAAPRFVAGVLAAFYTAFTAAWIYPGYVHNMGAHFVYDLQVQPFQLERASITVTEFDRLQYGALVNVLHEKSTNGYVYAGPDSPEVYVLGGFRNPTRHIFEFLAGAGYEDTILRELAARQVNVVAINYWPQFSGRFSDAFVGQLRARYPQSVQVGRFEVRWAR